MTLGEIEFLIQGVETWEETATSVEYAELVKIPAAAFANLVKLSPEIEEQIWRSAIARIKEVGAGKRDLSHSEFVQAALDSGLVQGNSILVIDLESCTRCDDCVRACAATHGGRPRFVREGSKLDNLLIAKSCYHCRDPVCLVGCPTGAIHRAGASDVVEIDDWICIGCGTCGSNCPYDAIVMHETGEVWPEDMIDPSLLRPSAGHHSQTAPPETVLEQGQALSVATASALLPILAHLLGRGLDRLLASKCDLCHNTGHGPACVSNCPQGCAYRAGSLERIQELLPKR